MADTADTDMKAVTARKVGFAGAKGRRKNEEKEEGRWKNALVERKGGLTMR